MAAKYGTTECGLCGCQVNVRPLTIAQATREGYDADYDGQYLAGRCDVCAGYKTVVYIEDVNGVTPALEAINQDR